MLLKKIFFFFLLICIISCSSKETTKIIEEEIDCINTDISISEEDNTVIPHATDPVVWSGSFNEQEVKISYTIEIGNDNETETYTFLFNKVNGCLKKLRAFKFYDGKEVDISAVTEMDFLEFYTKEWKADEKLSGYLVYTDPHDKKTYSRKFWLEFTNNDYSIEDSNYLYFNDCFTNKLPIDIDLNNDEIIDFKLIYEEINDIGNRPKYTQYTIKLVSTYEEKNKILSPRINESPYFIIFEAPFTSENTRQYFNGVKNTLDIFYEYEIPYQSFNYFLNNNLTYKEILENDKDNYYLVSMNLNDEDFYGWIKFNFNSTNCNVEVLDTFLNTNPNENISVD